MPLDLLFHLQRQEEIKCMYLLSMSVKLFEKLAMRKQDTTKKK